ncbi:MAG: bifunctional DNA-formamidopyrimidine glycosylase/DNA-(apurinic or apyrimidinic site) lyase [Jiangellaceae bacterium]|nr:bifunctional DNA-formamidopyrimidine glycosylase/DNA-(apurinic or apyrimidinic site) lyase [Jiangellaceae bacterium]
MPELPEVEVVRGDLQRFVVGRTIRDVHVLHPRAVRRHAGGPADFAAALSGGRLTEANRRGKYLWLPFSDNLALLAHLGMSGQLRAWPLGQPAAPHLRVRFTFGDGGPELHFVDQRTFGGLSVTRLGAGAIPEPITHIAQDPLDPAFDPATFRRALRRRRTGIKRALLDQSLVSGVGNIYADEALWRSELHYARPTETLTRAQVDRLVAALRIVLVAALAERGTSFDSLYVDVNGMSGHFDRSLQVYGQAGRPCARCGTPIARDRFMNRSSYYCPRCQRRPRRARW